MGCAAAADPTIGGMDEVATGGVSGMGGAGAAKGLNANVVTGVGGGAGEKNADVVTGGGAADQTEKDGGTSRITISVDDVRGGNATVTGGAVEAKGVNGSKGSNGVSRADRVHGAKGVTVDRTEVPTRITGCGLAPAESDWEIEGNVDGGTIRCHRRRLKKKNKRRQVICSFSSLDEETPAKRGKVTLSSNEQETHEKSSWYKKDMENSSRGKGRVYERSRSKGSRSNTMRRSKEMSRSGRSRNKKRNIKEREEREEREER